MKRQDSGPWGEARGEGPVNLLPEPAEARPSEGDLRSRFDLFASWRAGAAVDRPAGGLPLPRRRAVLAALGGRPRLEAALIALRRLGFGAEGIGVCGPPAALAALLACRFRAAPIHGLGPILVLGEAFVERPDGRPVVKALVRLQGQDGSDDLLVSDGWPLPPKPIDRPASGDLMRLLSATQARPAVLLGLRLPNTQSAALVCRTLLAIADGPVELQDLRAS